MSPHETSTQVVTSVKCVSAGYLPVHDVVDAALTACCQAQQEVNKILLLSYLKIWHAIYLSY
jgi:hypothetical protein